ncbi:MAG: nucleotidyl transferase AbiEii/AbiGii toxin family protein [Ignavibacteriales bacterium]|nr:nucleotidyl transferase AbiEii/AbiGii toxin family protein [Ignavibacteriales bacterium]
MINYDALIHNRNYFERDHIAARHTQYHFTQAIKVETFLWDLELFGQLQRRLGERVALKGGAAAQLYLAPERQRTSVDIDVIYLGSASGIPDVLASIHRDLGEDDLYFKFNKHTPLNPKTVLPLETYYVTVPAVTAKAPINIKLDFHLMDTLELPVVELEGAAAFVVPLAFKPRCISASALLGDKLLTLAQGSVGIPPEREDDIPKQLYDLHELSRIVDTRDVSTVIRAMGTLFARELAVRTEKVTLLEALGQMIVLLERYSGLDSAKSDKAARDAIQNFRSNYEPRPFRNPIAWGIVSKRLQLLARCFLDGAQHPLTYLQDVDRMVALIAFEDERFEKMRPALRESLRVDFIGILKTQGHDDVAKRLKNSLPERVLWEAVTPTNLEVIGEKIEARTKSI